MAPRWEALGFLVRIVSGADVYVPADIALLHVDLSVIPDAYRELVRRYPCVVNGKVFDIRKRRYSCLILNEGQNEDGAAIVKTDCNCGGWREFRLKSLESPVGSLLSSVKGEKLLLRYLARCERIEGMRPWGKRRYMPGDAYRVYDEANAVPKEVCGDIIEIVTFRSSPPQSFKKARFPRQDISYPRPALITPLALPLQTVPRSSRLCMK
jgi:hypothetical protein